MEHSRAIAIVGAGPAGAYALQHVLDRAPFPVEIDLYDRQPVPWGLVRHGVAADHQDKKRIIDRAFEPLMRDSRVRFLGGVEVGSASGFDDLRAAYDAVICAVGADGDNRLHIPGEDLPGSWSSREFVGWCNGDPRHARHAVALSGERAVIIGNGNVALDIARLLLRPASDLGTTDIADHALDVLAKSTIREVVIAARRGPRDAAFHNPEREEFGLLEDLDVAVAPSIGALEEALGDPDLPGGTRRKLETLHALALRPQRGTKRLIFRFFAAPAAICGTETVTGIRLAASSEPLESELPESELPCDIVIRATGYRGTPRPGLPFDPETRVVPTQQGRVIGSSGVISGLYATGWARRGCKGVIGSNRKCAGEVVNAILDDLAGVSFSTERAAQRAAFRRRFEASDAVLDKAGWWALDRAERLRGLQRGSPRVKFTSAGQMVQAGRIGR